MQTIDLAQLASVTGAEGRTFDDSAWSAVEVPHTWNRIGNEGTERSPLSNDRRNGVRLLDACKHGHHSVAMTSVG